MKLKNKIFNYFVIPPITSGGMPRVVLSPVTINAKVAKILIERQFKKEQKPEVPRGNILHVCFDYDSQRIYVPNAYDFSQNTMELLLQAAEVRITKDFGGFSSIPPIKGSPFSSLRVRSLNSFSHAKKVISEHYQGKVYKDLPVIEAFLSRMPNTVKSLPKEYQKGNFLGGYIGTNFAPSISFVEEVNIEGKKHREPPNLLTQVTPFILIDISYTAEKDEPNATEKEWAVLSGYRDYLHDTKAVSEEKYISQDINRFADLYAIKRYLYLGWSLEEVSSMVLAQDRVTNIVSLFKGIDRIMMAVNSLKQEGRKDIASIPYYITFKIDESFPIKLDPITDKNTNRIKTELQHPSLLVIEHDKRNGYVLIETPVFISPDVCIKVLNAKSTPFVGKYNPIVNTIDIKSLGKSYEELRRDRVQLAKIKGIVQSGLDPDNSKKLDYRGGDLASGISSVNPMVYNVRRVSDYLYAFDHIKAMCDIYKIPFKDFDVVIGPIQQVLGGGTQGGYMDAAALSKSNVKVPFELSKGVWLSPPVILINSVDNPSYAEQTETLIHEYSHYIYGIQHPNDTTEHYGSPKKGGTDYAYWYRYFTNPNERQAHRDEIKFELGLGKSYDEIIRNKVGGKITMENWPIALKFSEMVQEALKEIEEEKIKNEEPIAELKGSGLSD
jgi:hypothetical protein